MKRKNLVVTPLSPGPKASDLAANKQFIQNLETSLLFSLLHQKQLTHFQLEQCLELLHIKS